ncbi:MAG TPA: DUF4345 domain-containing protein [Coriobacteriia bacterium]|nr:DUF4345 domain-containing protein [Coriobacteriia bacterium]
MDWRLVPALAAAALMVAFGIGAVLRPQSLERVGVRAESALGSSEIRAVFGGMFIALGAACLVTREPIVFAVVGAAWLADVAVRLVAVVVDRVPAREALTVLGVGSLIGVALLSGYWFA